MRQLERPSKIEVMIMKCIIKNLPIMGKLESQMNDLIVVLRNLQPDFTYCEFEFTGEASLRLEGVEGYCAIYDTLIKFKRHDLMSAELMIHDGAISGLTIDGRVDFYGALSDFEKPVWRKIKRKIFPEGMDGYSPPELEVEYVDDPNLRDLDHAIGYTPVYR